MMMLPSRRQNNSYNQTHRLPNMNRPFNYRSVSRAQPNNIQRILSNFRQSPSNITSIATKSAGNISQTLSNVQQVLNVVQTAAPIVQEYGPMIRNIPAMYRMMKAFKEIDVDESEAIEGNVNGDLLLIDEDNDEDVKEDSNVQKVEHEPKQRYSNESVPKLYI